MKRYDDYAVIGRRYVVITAGSTQKCRITRHCKICHSFLVVTYTRSVTHSVSVIFKLKGALVEPPPSRPHHNLFYTFYPRYAMLSAVCDSDASVGSLSQPVLYQNEERS